MNKIYVYNKVQALYYINEFHCKVIDFDVHKTTLNPYVVFDKDDSKQAYESWCQKCNNFNK